MRHSVKKGIGPHILLYFSFKYVDHQIKLQIFSVFWIHNVLVRIRICNSKLRIQILLFSSAATKSELFQLIFLLIQGSTPHPPGGGGNMVSGPGGEKIWKKQCKRPKRERKEGDKTVIFRKITDWGEYLVFLSYFSSKWALVKRERIMSKLRGKRNLFLPNISIFFPRLISKYE